MHLSVRSSPDHGADRTGALASMSVALVLVVTAASSDALLNSQQGAIFRDRHGTVLDTMDLDIIV